jgi:hypothetical protein
MEDDRFDQKKVSSNEFVDFSSKTVFQTTFPMMRISVPRSPSGVSFIAR